MSAEQHRDLVRLVHGSPWFMHVLRAARVVNPPDWWVGGGVLRDLVWDSQAGGLDPNHVKDVDLAFFDSHDLSRERDQQIEETLRAEAPDVTWDAKNQAAVHTWYSDRFGIQVEPLTSSADGVATWPETATAVAVRLDANDQVQLTAAHGLDDLLGAVCRRNRRRVTAEEYRQRVERKQIALRWPHVRVVLDAPDAPSDSSRLAVSRRVECGYRTGLKLNDQGPPAVAREMRG